MPSDEEVVGRVRIGSYRVAVKKDPLLELAVWGGLAVVVTFVPFAVGLSIHTFTAYDISQASFDAPFAFWGLGALVLVMSCGVIWLMVMVLDSLFVVEGVDDGE